VIKTSVDEVIKLAVEEFGKTQNKNLLWWSSFYFTFVRWSFALQLLINCKLINQNLNARCQQLVKNKLLFVEHWVVHFCLFNRKKRRLNRVRIHYGNFGPTLQSRDQRCLKLTLNNGEKAQSLIVTQILARATPPRLTWANLTTSWPLFCKRAPLPVAVE